MILHPTLEEARALASKGNLCPLYAEVPGRPRDAGFRVSQGRARALLVPAGERGGRRTPGALQLHRHGAISHAA